MKRPEFFIVGAPKCGTTSLYVQLQEHPEIFLPRVKEPAFFDVDLYQPKRVTNSLEQYLSYFAEATDGQIAGEASTSYLYSARAATEIAAFEPNAKIIAMIRDPVELMHSFHSQLVYQGTETIDDFEAALEASDQRRPRTQPGAQDRLPQVLLYRDVACLCGQLERYFDTFGRERVLVLLLDDYQRDPRRVYAQVLDFLGVSPGFEPEFKIVNRFKGLRSRRLHRFLVAPPRPLRAAVRAVVPPKPRYALLGRVRALNTRPQARPPMDPKLAARLRSEFAAEVARLGVLLGRDLSAWTAGSVAVRAEA